MSTTVARFGVSFLINAFCALPSRLKGSVEELEDGSSLAPSCMCALAGVCGNHVLAHDSSLTQLVVRLASVILHECPPSWSSRLVTESRSGSGSATSTSDGSSAGLFDRLSKVRRCGCWVCCRGPRDGGGVTELSMQAGQLSILAVRVIVARCSPI